MWTVLRPSFEEAYGPRDESKCLYMNDTVACTFLAVTMLKCRSKNAIDGCDSVWKICEANRWKFVTTFKEGRMPDVYANVALRFRTNVCERGELLKCDACPLWQLFQRGFLLRLETGCRKMKQILWAEELRTFIWHFGLVGLVPRYRLFCRKRL